MPSDTHARASAPRPLGPRRLDEAQIVSAAQGDPEFPVLRYWRLDVRTGRLVDASEASPDDVVRSSRELRTTPVSQMIGQEGLGRILRQIARDVDHYRSTGEHRVGVVDVPFVNRNGSRGWRRLHTSVVYDADDNPIEVQGCSLDISDLKRTEEALRRSERDFRGLFEGAHDAIVIFRPEDEVVLEANEHACQTYRMSRDVLVGSSLADLAVDPDAGRKKIQETLAKQQFHRFESRQRRGDGSLMHLEINAATIEYRGRRAIVSINRDVTELRRAEQRLRERDEELQRARSLAAIEQLAATIAHDFNNMLAVVRTCAEGLARRLPSGGPLEEDVRDILAAVGRGSHLIGQLREATRRPSPPPSELDVSHVVRDLRPLLERLLGDHRELRLDLADDLERLTMERGELERALVNLVVNARDATRPDGVVVVGTRRGDEHESVGDHVVIEVSDDGCGMEPSTLSQVFEPLFTTKEHGGTGLGLSSVRGVVDRIGGVVDVESTPRQGTTFRLRLPTQPAGASGPPTRAAAPDAWPSPVRFRSLLDGVDDAVYVADAVTGRFVDVTEAATRMLGFSREELLRMGPGDLKASPLRGPAGQWERQVERLRSSDGFDLTTLHRRKDGGRVPVEMRVSLREHAGHEYVVGVCRRAPDRRSVSAGEALASLGNMAEGIAHQVNNPLAYAANNVEHVLHELGDHAAPEIRSALKDARRGILSARRVMRDLTGFAQHDPIDRVPVRVSELVALAKRTAAAEEPDVAEVLDAVEPGLEVLGDEAALAQVLANLIVNASRAMEREARPRVRVRAERHGDRVRVAVTDHGRGIAEADLPRVFEPFFTTRLAGTGLGLAVCERIVGQAGGRIWATSVEGRGSTFFVELDAAPARDHEVLTVRARPPAAILIVDDDRLVANSMRRLLRRHHVRLAETGQAALSILEEEDFDVILCDLMMPNMTGMELHAYLDRTRPDVAARMAFVTGGVFTEAARAFVRTHEDRCYEKPVPAGKLERIVQSLRVGPSGAARSERPRRAL